MTKIKILSIAVISLLVLNIGLIVFLLLHKPPFERKGGPKELIIQQLHFNDEQIDEYEKLIEEHQLKIKGLDKSIKDAKNTLYLQLNNDSSLLKDSLLQLLSNYQLQIETVHYNHFIDIKKLCEPEQIKNFEALTKDLSKHFSRNKNHPPQKK